ncbi:MAG: DNA cytosine methyltransferase, partial [Defluviitaleaceae bacterium]|nr:DNA cytosine methyltransferase [Defluviitaleaceae bacterium]
SGLFFQMVRIIREMREATGDKFPRYVVVENVTGMYSSNKGQDFREVLNELCKIKDETISVPMPPKDKWLGAGEIVADGFSLAYRTLCASGWGVPQRRRRCYLVVDFDGESAGEILFNESRLHGNSASGGCPWQGTAKDSAVGIGSASGEQSVAVFEPGAASRLGGHFWHDIAGTLRADAGDNIPAVVYDARGNGDGKIANTITGDHENRITDYTKVAVTPKPENAPLVMNERQHALTISEGVANTLTGTDYKGTQCVFEPKTLKIRSGKPGGGGRGALIQDNLSATLSCNNDQTLFVQEAAGFMGGQGAKAGSIAYSEELSPTIRSEASGNSVPMVFGICSENSNSMKSGSKNPHSGIYEMEISRTLDTGACAGNGGQVVVCLEGNGTRPSHKGSGFREDVSFNLNCVERHAVAYDETNVNIEETDSESEATYAMTTGSYTQIYKEQSPTLMSRDYKDPHVVQVALENYQHSGYREVETAGTLKASGGDYPGGENVIVENSYVVRRLVPQECSLLQGFPKDYCADLATPEPTEAEIEWWAGVFETHRKAMGKATKPKSRNQIIKWLKNPYTDSAEYKLWGNGIALPCGYFVLSGIVWANSNL